MCHNELNRFTLVCQGSVSGLLERAWPQMILRQTFWFIFDDALNVKIQDSFCFGNTKPQAGRRFFDMECLFSL